MPACGTPIIRLKISRTISAIRSNAKWSFQFRNKLYQAGITAPPVACVVPMSAQDCSSPDAPVCGRPSRADSFGYLRKLILRSQRRPQFHSPRSTPLLQRAVWPAHASSMAGNRSTSGSSNVEYPPGKQIEPGHHKPSGRSAGDGSRPAGVASRQPSINHHRGTRCSRMHHQHSPGPFRCQTASAPRSFPAPLLKSAVRINSGICGPRPRHVGVPTVIL